VLVREFLEQRDQRECVAIVTVSVLCVNRDIADLMWSASRAEEKLRCWTWWTKRDVHTVSQAKGLETSLSDCGDSRRFGMHTQARSARFKTGRVLLSLPNKIPATAQNRTFVESSSVMRRNERPKMVSFGSLRQCSGDILLRVCVRLAGSMGKRLITVGWVGHQMFRYRRIWR